MSEQQPKCRHCKKEILYDQLKKESYWNNILKLYKTLGFETSTAIEENRMKNKNITFVKFIKRNLTHTTIQIIYNIQRKEPHFEIIFYRNMFDFNL